MVGAFGPQLVLPAESLDVHADHHTYGDRVGCHIKLTETDLQCFSRPRRSVGLWFDQSSTRKDCVCERPDLLRDILLNHLQFGDRLLIAYLHTKAFAGAIKTCKLAGNP